MTSFRFASALLLFVAHTDVEAQFIDPARFILIGHGDYWKYVLAESTPTSFPPPSFVSLEILGDTAIDGIGYAEVLETTFRIVGNETAERLCGVRIDSLHFFSTIGISPPEDICYFTAFYPFRNGPFNEIVPSAKVEISSISYDASAIASHARFTQATGGSGGGHLYWYAADIGLYSARNHWNSHWAAGGSGGH